ncbi:MAG TPA: hypothetical protein VGO63_03030 [Candidatus Paceibacterota bacterium]|jgi:hypothetical protein|nr:hypothetical protein [Candidatus Paceibacterota bacterium]
MKKFVFVIVLLSAIFGLSAAVSAQSKPDKFSSKASCEAALTSGNYTVYEPKYFGLKDKNPVNGTTRITAPLETTECLEEFTVVGSRWVVQNAGTMMRWNVNPDGTLSLYARDDCGNPASLTQLLPVTSRETVFERGSSTSQAGAGATSTLNFTAAPAQVAVPTLNCWTAVRQKKTYRQCNDGSEVMIDDGSLMAAAEKQGCGFWCWADRVEGLVDTTVDVADLIVDIKTLNRVNRLLKQQPVATGGKPPTGTTGPSFPPRGSTSSTDFVW